jgi:hypothetical protein
MTDEPYSAAVPARRRSLRPYLLASGIVTAVGLAAHSGALLWNEMPLPEGTGPNIGAGLLWLAGLLVAACGFVMLFAGGVLVSLAGRRR